jgi:hypothetical protein
MTEVATIRLISPVLNFSIRLIASPGVTFMLGEILAFLAVTLLMDKVLSQYPSFPCEPLKTIHAPLTNQL